MEISKLLEKYENVAEGKIEYNNILWEYFQAEYFINKNRLLKYYIFDFTDDGNKKEWTKVEFAEFQTALLRDEFFECSGDERYNIYLIFIVTDDNSIKADFEIESDFQYARKIILRESEAKNFLVTLFPLIRKEETNDLSLTGSVRQKEVRRKLLCYSEEVTKLFRRELQTYLSIEKSKKAKDKKKQNEFMNEVLGGIYNDSLLNEYVRNYKPTKGKMPDNQPLTMEENYEIGRILSLKVKKYRRFNKECNVEFKKVNLLFGDNGVGKTSVLDAIEMGITGYNKGAHGRRETETDIEIQCQNAMSRKVSILYSRNNLRLAKKWYGITCETDAEFNKLFNQYNYFDTMWASAFAIEGEERVNLKQLQRFLGIDDLEEYVTIILKCCRNLEKLATWNIEHLSKSRNKRDTTNFFGGRKADNIHTKMEMNSQDALKKAQESLAKLELDVIPIKWEEVVKEHITKIESLFKMLVSPEEYEALNIVGDEIVAIRAKTKERVRMFQMSTGQKVCLALAFMFALFLSSETAPNVILLDEPVANLDDLHMLNLLDLLRRLAMSGTQIFFTTANPDVARLFRRKFSYLEEDFGFYRIMEQENKLQINYEQYTQKQNEPIKVFKVFSE